MIDAQRPAAAIGVLDILMFGMELLAWVGIARLAVPLVDGAVSTAIVGLGLFIVATAIWGTFRARGYHPAGREPIVAVPGPVALGVEVGSCLVGVAGWWWSGLPVVAIALGLLTLVIYLGKWPRTLAMAQDQ